MTQSWVAMRTSREHAFDVRAHRLEDVGTRFPIDLEMRPRFEQRVRAVVTVVAGRAAAQFTGGRAQDPHDGMDDEMDAEVVAIERHRARVDQERHVVGDDVDGGVPARRRVDADDRFARRAVAADAPVLEGHPREVVDASHFEVLVVDRFEVAARELVGAGGIAGLGQLANPGDYVVASGRTHDTDHTVLIGRYRASRMLGQWTGSTR